MTCYIVSVKVPSEKAGKYRGHPYAWKGHWRFRGRLPSGEREFHQWLLGILRSHGFWGGTVKIIRPQARGESAGFKRVFYGVIDADHVKAERLSEKSSGDVHKPIPNLPWSRQPWYVAEKHRLRERERFKGTGRWGAPPKRRDKRS
jgi:hypothetical protein